MTDPIITIRDLIQEDVNNRGLRALPDQNLVTACASDFAAACRSIADNKKAAVAVVTGFYIAHAEPPSGETDGPLGALFLARALVPLGIRVVLVTDAFCTPALEAGVAMAGLRKSVPIVTLPPAHQFDALSPDAYWENVAERMGPLTHLIALERVGPSHTPESLAAHPETQMRHLEEFGDTIAEEHHNRCHSMKGRDITANVSPAHLLFEAAARQRSGVVTIGIGDGGNEIGMGKLHWDLIRGNIPGGDLVACRIPTDYLLVCGVSNWGAYGLATGVRLLRGVPAEEALYDLEAERRLLEAMVTRGGLVDGVSGEASISVDGLEFEEYAEPLRRLAALEVPPQPAVPANGAPPPRPEELAKATGAQIRALRAGQLNVPTVGLALGYVHANLVVVPRELAFDFLLFCQRNPKPCPLLDVTEPGSAEPVFVAKGADLRTDLPRYRVYKEGVLIEEPTDLHAWWRDDLVAFLLGCSFTFENALIQGNLIPRHIEAGCNVPMYKTNLMCRPAGVFHGPMVVSMRPLTPAQAIAATRICARFPRAHGTPVHFGDPAAIGIQDINRPDFGDPVEIRDGEVPVFWACGVTPQAVAMEVRPPLMLTHKPGYMFVTDLRDVDLEGE